MGRGAEVEQIISGSIAAEIELSAGDRIISVNGQPIIDLIDYRLLTSDEEIELEVLKSPGGTVIYEIEKDSAEDLGIVFSTATFDGLRRCKNKCVFCFVDQMPPDLRPSLYVKDDDYRHSFLHGNFITLTNLTEEDIERIIANHLSPLYISVHTTDSSLRVKMLRNRKAGEIMKVLRRLSEHGIEMHTQAVLCPGWNDADQLEKTITNLRDLWPQVGSLAVVPVGLTKYRESLPSIIGYDSIQAEKVLRIVTSFQENYLKEIKSRFVFAADEFYLQARCKLPNIDYYEDFPQLENGVGIVRLFLDECYDYLQNLSDKPTSSYGSEIIVATGFSASKVLNRIIDAARKIIPGLSAEILAVENSFFGPYVTVSGLLTGSDLIAGLAGKVKGKKVLLPEVLLRPKDRLFLDGMSLQQLAAEIQAEVEVISVSGRKFMEKLIEV